jgi:membrane protein DedA with SNARE-associated domain
MASIESSGSRSIVSQVKSAHLRTVRLRCRSSRAGSHDPSDLVGGTFPGVAATIALAVWYIRKSPLRPSGADRALARVGPTHLIRSARDEYLMRSLVISESILSLIPTYGVPLVALLIFVGELGVPTGIPSEVALLLAGAYAIDSVPSLLAGLALVCVADILGTVGLHFASRTGGVRLLRRFLPNQASGREGVMDRWRRRLGGHDVSIVFVMRLIPLVRMYISVSTGLLRIRVRDFLLGAVPASVLWAGTPLAAGYVFRTHVQGIVDRVTQTSQILLVLLPALGAGLLVVWWVRRRQVAQS